MPAHKHARQDTPRFERLATRPIRKGLSVVYEREEWRNYPPGKGSQCCCVSSRLVIRVNGPIFSKLDAERTAAAILALHGSEEP
jgi:hypothetical protein